MKTKTKVIIGIVGAGVITALGIYLSKKKKTQKYKDILGIDNSSSVDSYGKNKIAKFPLENGSGFGAKSNSNAEVKIVQKHLNDKTQIPYQLLKVDGKFGKLTGDRLDLIYKTKQVSYDLYSKMYLETSGPSTTWNADFLKK